MKVTRYDEPWTHLVVDDFIDKDSFEYLSSNYKDIFSKGDGGRSVYQFDKLPDESSLNGKILSSVVKIWNDYYHDINHGLDRSDLVDNIIFEWRFTSPYDKRYRSVHRDSPGKLMSTVYYISDDGIGTTLLERVKENEPMNISKTIEWKPNRALIFVRNGLDVGGTWHRAQNDADYERFTMNLAICSKIDKSKNKKIRVKDREEYERNKEK